MDIVSISVASNYAVNEKRLSLNAQYEPHVSVSTKKADGYVAVRIADNGIGIRQFKPI